MLDRHALRFSPLLLALFTAAACGDGDETPDASTTRPDARADAGSADRPAPDAEPEDAGFEDATAADGGDAGPADTGPIDGGAGLLIPGLSAPVRIDYDDHAIPHVTCATNEDCFAAQGYLHASHRFGQMDLRRRFVRGRLSEVFGLVGDLVLNIDRASRSFIATRDGGRLEEQLWQNADADTRSAITAYTRGVNAWIADLRAGRNGARVTEDWAVPASLITDWEELDSAACMLGLLEDLTNESAREIELGRLAQALPPEQFVDLFGLMPASRSTILPPPAALRNGPAPIWAQLGAARPTLAEVEALLRQAGENLAPLDREERGFGSNNWVVSPALTTNGKALLANDPHLGLSNPPVWYVISLDSTGGTGDLHVAGVSFAGVPSIILGQNDRIAWGATTTFFDAADVYLEQLTRTATAVRFEGADVPLIAREFIFERTPPLAPVTETFYYVPHHGPVVAIDPANRTAVSVRWTGHDADTDLNFLLRMARAASATEARTALTSLTTTGQNFVVADVTGNIGWFPYSRVPERPWAEQFAPYLPLPGTGQAEWDGFMPYDELPQALNPAGGFLSTANNDMNGNLRDGDPTNDGNYLQHFVAAGYRHERIVQRLEDQRGAHDRGTMESILADVYSLVGEDTVPPVLDLATTATASLDDGGRRVVAALATWNYQCPTGLNGIEPDSEASVDRAAVRGSIGCMAFHAMFGRLHRAVFADEISAAGLTARARVDALPILLTREGSLAGGGVYWDDVSTTTVTETAPEIVARVLNDTGAYLTAELGPDVNDWRWGRRHTLTIAADFAQTFTSGPWANDGGLFTVDVANPQNLYADNYAHRSGASMRLACEADETDGIDCTIQLPGGQRGFPDSPFYDDLLRLWLVNQPYPLWFEAADVAAASREVEEINPAP